MLFLSAKLIDLFIEKIGYGPVLKLKFRPGKTSLDTIQDEGGVPGLRPQVVWESTPLDLPSSRKVTGAAVARSGPRAAPGWT